METYVLRVWLSDRPGALGQVASRIGAVRGDVVGIEILERGGGQVVDELVVTLPEPGNLELLLHEIAQVDGVAVEDVQQVDEHRQEHGQVALAAATELAACTPAERLVALCRRVLDLVDGDWVVALADGTDDPLHTEGAAPDGAWVAAFVRGSSHLDLTAAQTGPAELAWAVLERAGVVVAVERAGRVFRTRERQYVAELGRLVDALGVEV